MRVKKYSFAKDLEVWKHYALKIHSNHARKHDAYTFLQSIVDRCGHTQVAKKNQPHEVVLEIGAGGGGHIRYELPFIKDKQYFATEINLNYTKIIKSLYPVTAVNADALFLPFKNDTFDSCIAIGVLEHISELERALCQIKRVLKETGDFFAVVPTNGSLCIELFKFFVTYPCLYAQGIKSPSRIWHYENVNTFKRILSLIEKNFIINDMFSVPFRYIYWGLSPFYFFHCKKKDENLKKD